MCVLNIAAIILLGLVLQIGGAYLVNAAVGIMGEYDEGGIMLGVQREVKR